MHQCPSSMPLAPSLPNREDNAHFDFWSSASSSTLKLLIRTAYNAVKGPTSNLTQVFWDLIKITAPEEIAIVLQQERTIAFMPMSCR